MISYYFHDWEFEFFAELYRKLDRHRKNNVSVYTLLTALIFLSTETDKKTKFRTVFRSFDTDEDGCLTQDQILLLYRTI